MKGDLFFKKKKNIIDLHFRDLIKIIARTVKNSQNYKS